MKARDIMSRDVVTIGPETSVAAAASLLVQHRVSGLPVVDEQRRVVGMFTEGDLLHRVENDTGECRRSRWLEFLVGPGREAAEYVTSHSRRVGDLMTHNVATVTEETSLSDIVAVIEKHHVRRVPVLRDGILVGIVSRLDLVRVLTLKLAAATGNDSDIDIERRLKAELDAQPWAVASNVAITVRDRVVTLEGLVYDERVRNALLVAAKNVDGGVSVEDNLRWADPTTGLVLGA